jgi:radical S-adenosyl methionine domain-containing protein 2
VVSAVNRADNLAEKVKAWKIDRWKIMKMQLFENGEFSNRCITIHETDYSRYVRRALKEFGLSYREADSMVYDAGGMEIVAEKVLRASYIMVDAKGWLVDDSRNDSYTMISDCLTEPFADGYSRLPLNRENYMKRYEEALQDPRLPLNRENYMKRYEEALQDPRLQAG